MKKILSLFFAISLFVAGHPQAYAQNTAQAAQTLAEQKNAAALLLQQGHYEQAYLAFSRLLREDPGSDRINLGYARAALRTERPGQAVMAYERLLTNHPNEPVLLKELALALKMQDDTQRSNLELAKAPKTSDTVVRTAPQKEAKQSSRTRISGKLRAGVLYDSNVNSGPASNDLSLGEWNLRLKDGKAEGSLAGYVGAHMQVLHHLDTDKPWWLVGDGGFYIRYNANEDLHDMDLSSSEWVTASFGMRHVTSNSLFDMRVRAQVFAYAFDQSIFAVGPEMQFIYAATPQIHLITKANLSSRTYSNSHHYDGWYTSAGQYVRVFLGSKDHSLTLGGRYIGGYADDTTYSYDGFEGSASFAFLLPFNEIKLSPFISYSGKYYHGPATVVEVDNREDYRLNTGVTAHVPINDAWGVDVSYQYSQNYSNSALYDYKQHIVSMGVSWSF